MQRRTGRRRALAAALQLGLRAVLVVILGVGLAVPNVSVTVNAGLALVVTFLPAALQRDRSVRLSPAIALWLTTAVTLHALGMLVLYESVPWWDHLTHLVSGALVAGVGFALVRSFDDHSDAVSFPPQFVGLFVVLFTIAAGVLWEVLELVGRELARSFDMDPVLIVYGLEDTMMDLIVDALAGVLVAVLGSTVLGRRLDALVERVRRQREA